MNERWYLVDNNVLSRLTAAQRTSEFFSENCRVSSEVLYEARDYVEESVADAELPTTAAVLRRLKEVMSAVDPGDTTLVDLYANKGAADPVMIAAAREEQAHENATLFPSAWVIVTDDKAVASTARRVGLKVMASPDFQAQFPSR